MGITMEIAGMHSYSNSYINMVGIGRIDLSCFVLGFWDKNTGIYAGAMPYRGRGGAVFLGGIVVH